MENPARKHVRYGGTIPPEIVHDITDQFNERLHLLKFRYPERDYRHITIAMLMGTGKAWISDFLLKKYTDVRVSSLFRLATVLGCDIKIILIPKENRKTINDENFPKQP